jgi:WD40 repeat protein
LYLPRSTHTQVVDASDGKVVGDIQNNSRSHGVAFVPELGRGFISNGGDGTVQVFDLKSNKSLGKIKAADDADCIIFDPATKNDLAMCGDAHEMIAIAADVEVDSGKAKSTIDLGQN